MRWWREFRRPILKCWRIGHKTRVEYRRGFVRPEAPRYHVCDAVTEERDGCARCGLVMSEWRQRDRHGFTGYSWPADQAEEFRQAGEYWTEQGFRSAA